MSESLKALRAARELLSQPALSEGAELMFAATMGALPDDLVASAVTALMRTMNQFPTPAQVREVAEQIRRATEKGLA